MMILFFLLFVCLFLGLILFVGRRINRSETADIINQSICISAGIHPKK